MPVLLSSRSWRVVGNSYLTGLRQSSPSSARNVRKRSSRVQLSRTYEASSVMLRSIEQPLRVELLVGLDIAFSSRCQCPEYLSCKCKRSQTICCDNTSIMHRWRRPIKFSPTILVDILPDEVLAVARVKTIIEQPTVSQGQSRSTNRGNRPVQSDHGPHHFRNLRYFSFRPGLTTRENENMC